jgi:GNAT superfamily N-acetyltransferase
LRKWAWMHKNNPNGFHGSEGDIWVAESSDGTLVGYYGRIRYAMHCLGEVILASQALDMATHPQFRRLGIAKELVTSSIGDARSNGIKLTFGFPNPLSYHIALREGAYDAGQASELHLVLDPSAYTSSLESRPVRRMLWRAELAISTIGSELLDLEGATDEYETVSGFTEDAGSVEAAVQSTFDLGLVRTREYLTWRYDPNWGDYETSSLLNRGMCSGYIVTRTVKQGSAQFTRILEFIARDDDPRTYRALLSVALEKARRGGSAQLAVSSALSDGCLRTLRRLGFRNARRAGGYVLNPYDDSLRQNLRLARVYQSLGDRDYL